MTRKHPYLSAAIASALGALAGAAAAIALFWHSGRLP
jgi:hypothetical protein